VKRALAALLLLWSTAARAQQDGADAEIDGYSPGEAGPAWTWGGYLDVGFANAEGNGTSFSPVDARLPADYAVDPFATAVNSRGDVASIDSGGRFTNGFLPRSMGIGGRPSVFINTVSFDLLYAPRTTPISVFSRVQLLPRFSRQTGSETRLFLEQAFGKLSPFSTVELSLSVGRFDSVFGIEYLENQANLRTGITPSLVARYTTGTAIGAKAFYRLQIAPLWSALSLNLAATNGGTFVEALQPQEISLTGRPVGSGRVGYELNTPGLQLKLGGSGLYGPRNDQGDQDALQKAFGADARIYVLGLSLAGEYVHVDEDRGPGNDKSTGAGAQTGASAFHVRGFYAWAAYELPLHAGFLHRVTIYGRYDHRHAWFEGFLPVTVQRWTGGLRLDLWETLALKGEYLRNLEGGGAPPVANDVVAGSAVFSF
jgi:hypothetical protein